MLAVAAVVVAVVGLVWSMQATAAGGGAAGRRPFPASQGPRVRQATHLHRFAVIILRDVKIRLKIVELKHISVEFMQRVGCGWGEKSIATCGRGGKKQMSRVGGAVCTLVRSAVVLARRCASFEGVSAACPGAASLRNSFVILEQTFTNCSRVMTPRL